jgi:ribose-phosphate pyrophosphokinase
VTPLAVHAFPDEAEPARALAKALGVPFGIVGLHVFPDRELLPTVPEPAETVIVYRSLHHPNEKLVALMLAADAWRRSGVKRLALVAPYLCYMRQDQAFFPGQPVSRDVVGDLLGRRFDRILTVQAHLHRTPDLAGVFGGVRAENLSAAPALVAALGSQSPPPLVVGPDVESSALAEETARLLGTDWMAFRKARRGDHEVELSADDIGRARGRAVLMVDDICSSGTTVVEVAERLAKVGAGRIVLAVAHALFDWRTAEWLRFAGVSHIVSTDSAPHWTNAAPLARVLADALSDEVRP